MIIFLCTLGRSIFSQLRCYLVIIVRVEDNVEAENRGGRESMATDGEQSRRTTSLGIRSQARVA